MVNASFLSWIFGENQLIVSSSVQLLLFYSGAISVFLLYCMRSQENVYYFIRRLIEKHLIFNILIDWNIIYVGSNIEPKTTPEYFDNPEWQTLERKTPRAIENTIVTLHNTTTSQFIWILFRLISLVVLGRFEWVLNGLRSFHIVVSRHSQDRRSSSKLFQVVSTLS